KFTFAQVATNFCSKAAFWIEDASGKRWSAYDQTVTNVATPHMITVNGFLGMATPYMVVNIFAPPIPPSGHYKAVVQGQSADCNGTVYTWFEKRKAYEIVMLGEFAPEAQVGTANYITLDRTFADPSLEDSSYTQYFPAIGCNATFCAFHKGLPTLG